MASATTTPSDDIVIYGPDCTVYDDTPGKPKVFIVGAGIAGLTLALLLHKADIPFEIFEKTADARTIGSALYLGPDLFSIFHQLGIADEIIEQSKPCNNIEVFGEDRRRQFVIDFTHLREFGGYEGRLIPRTVIHNILASKVPTEHLHQPMRMLSMTQGENGVKIRFANGTDYEGDILVGADGAYSAVRQSLYERLKKDKKLPPSDAKELPFSCVCLAGHSGKLDPEKFTELKDSKCRFYNTLGANKPYSWSVFTTQNDVICWNVFLYLDKKSSKMHNTFKTTDWGEGAVGSMCDDVRDFPIPGGDGTLTMGDLIDGTPMNQMTKVMLEEKVFDTWYHCRTVLIGDACHKIHPAGGQGALLGFHDAIALANWINVLPSKRVKHTEYIFKQYKRERYPFAKAAYNHGRNMSNDLKASITRYIQKNMPHWLWRVFLTKIAAQRPQAAFLPYVPDSGTVKAAYQHSLVKTTQMMKDRAAKEAAEAAKEDTTTTATNQQQPQQHEQKREQEVVAPAAAASV
ncbi:hypothetical protein BGX23_009874 [Mortierella sp. AD031]|nr:hypothetical protein BGX23_009874 [Mortierella sp. AD031]